MIIALVKIRILHIDDNIAFLKATKLYLEKFTEHFQISSSPSVDDALNKLQENDFDVIVSDYLMPDQDGLDLLKILRNSNNDIPFIMFTGKGREEVVIQALNLGADFYLQKGEDTKSQFHELVNLVEKCFEKKQTEKALRKTHRQQKAQFNGTPVPIYVYEKQGDNFILVDYNAMAYQVTKGMIEKRLGIKASTAFKKYPSIVEHMRLCYENKNALTDELEYTIPTTQEDQYYSIHYAFIPPNRISMGVVNLTEIKERETEREKYLENLMFLSKTAMDFIVLSPHENIYRYIVNKINKKIVEGSIVGLASYNKKTNTFVTRAISGLGKNLKKIMSLLGKNPEDLEVTLTEKVLKYLSSNKLQKIPGGLKELTGKILRPRIAKKIEAVLQIGDVYSLGFVHNGEIFGGVIILTQKGEELKNREVLEAFANQSSVALLRQQALAILRESEEKYRNIINQLSEGVIIAKANPLRIVFANPAMEQIWGYSPDEFTSFSSTELLNLLYPDDREACLQRFQKRLAGKELADHFEFRGIRKDDSVIYLSTTERQIDYENEKALLAVYKDITEEKIVKKKLEESEQRLLQFVEENPLPILIRNLKTKAISINAKFTEILGYSEKDFTSPDKWLEKLYPDPDYRKKLLTLFEQDLKKLKKGKRITPREVKIVRKDGKTLDFVWRFVNVNDELCFFIGEDISHRKKIEEVLRTSGSRYRTIIESLNIPVHLISKDYRFILVNRAMYEWIEKIGLTFDPIGKKLLEVFPFLGQNIIDEYDRVMDSGEILVSDEETVINNHIYYTETQKIPLLNEKEISGVITVIFDLTDIKRVEKELRQKQKELKVQRDELESYTSRVAHDIKNKLQIIRNYNDLIQDSHYSKKIENQIMAIITFLDNLLFLAKKGEILGDIWDVNLQTLVSAIAEKLQPLSPGLEIEIRDLPVINGDPVTLQQVFENLIMNTIIHAAATKLVIYSEKTDIGYKIIIRDNGKGFSKEKLEKLKESLAKKDYTHLGLMIVQKIIRAHQGSFNIESSEGEGTVVILHFKEELQSSPGK
ncbi:MAG: PAS domain S-box protein [Candidatus Heimdallarchaeota archaeon]|nr:PAS domain S-box protein [Candidatus Heimdallarchaeota archaeon]